MSGLGIDMRPANAARQETINKIERSLALIQRWVEDHNYRGYEPFDGLSSWARPLACGSLLGESVFSCSWFASLH